MGAGIWLQFMQPHPILELQSARGRSPTGCRGTISSEQHAALSIFCQQDAGINFAPVNVDCQPEAAI